MTKKDDKNLNLSLRQHGVMEFLSAILKPLKNAPTLLSEDTTVTAPYVLQFVMELASAFEAKDSDLITVATVKGAILNI